MAGMGFSSSLRVPWSRNRRAGVLVAAAQIAMVVGCKNPPPAGGTTTAAASSSAASEPSAPKMPFRRKLPPADSAVPAHPDVCEVEFFGQVRPAEAGKPPPPVVFASYDDCLSATPVNIGQTTTQPDGKFFLEVFVKWGSDLTLCAAQLPAQDKPTKLYGKAAGPFHAEAIGEVEFKGVVIEMKPAASRTFPGPRVSGGF
jgi:hypothetical protein